MHTSLDKVTWHVMDAMADDWESIAQIRPHVHQYCGVRSDEEIFAALRDLHQDELVEIMKVPEQASDTFQTHPDACWFGMTETGRKLWDSEGVKYRDAGQV